LLTEEGRQGNGYWTPRRGYVTVNMKAKCTCSKDALSRTFRSWVEEMSWAKAHWRRQRWLLHSRIKVLAGNVPAGDYTGWTQVGRECAADWASASTSRKEF